MLTLRTVAVADLVAYPNNPRIISTEAMAAMMASIEAYGYQAPIVVDQDLVVLAGHTRLQALKRLGHVDVTVVISELEGEKADQYRVVDNRAAELVPWDTSKLIPELEAFEDPDLLARFFPDVDLDKGYLGDAALSDDAKARAMFELDRRATDWRRTVTCPECGGSFQI